MKIAILSLYSGRVNRGVETWVEEISKMLVDRGNEVEVFSGKIAWKKLIKFSPDIVLPCNGGMQSLLVKLFSFVFGWKTVITGHAGIGRDDKWNLLIRPDYFVSPSARGEKWAKSLWFAKGLKIAHIPHGVDLNRFNPKVKKIKLDLPRPIFLCVASSDSYKQVNLTKKAIEKFGKGSLLVIGQDKKVNPEEMPGYYASSDVFTLVSDSHEAFGIVYLEALASNLPVVATNDSLRREIVGKAGILVDPNDVEAYARALKTAATKDWGDMPRRQAEGFSWEMVANKYEEIFEKLI